MITETTPTARPGEAQSAEEPRLHWRLHVLACPDRRFRGQVIDIGQDPLRLGRSASGTGALAIGDPLLSREHLELRLAERGTAVDLRDLGSSNGTFRGGARVAAAVLGHNAVLRFGATVAVLEAELNTADIGDAPTADLPGRSAAARWLRGQVAKLAVADGPVMIVGPTGSGKESVLNELVRRSGRSGPISRLACAGMTAERLAQALGGPDAMLAPAHVQPQGTAGLLEQCTAGWLVLDHPLALPATAQALLPALLDAGHADPMAPRIACLCSQDPAELTESRHLRPDVWARLRPSTLAVPRLSDRRADLADLADVVAPPPRHGDSWRDLLAAEVWEALALRPWPYGLHELRADFLKAAAVVGSAPLTLAQWRQCTSGDADAGAGQLEAVADRTGLAPDADALRRLLKRHAGNVERVAEHFGRHRKQIYRWIDRAGIAATELEQWRRGP